MLNDPIHLLQSQEQEFLQFWRTQIEQVSSVQYVISEDLFRQFELKSLSEQEQILISIYLSKYNQICGELDPMKEHQLIKQFLFRFRMRLTNEDVLTRVGSDDFIEIYDAQGIQIYRSWSFFKFCRYPIDDVLTKSWNELYDRPEFVTTKLYSLMPMLFRPDAKQCIDYNIEEFVLAERLLQPSMKYLVKMKFACPIEDVQTGKNVAFLSVASAKKLQN